MARCPACSELLFRRRLEGIEAEGCPACGGVWLDEGELQTLARAPSSLRALSKTFVAGMQAGPAQQTGLCPRCSQPLTPFEFAQLRGVRLERCQACGGVWLDHGEAEAIAARLDPPAPADAAIVTGTPAARRSSDLAPASLTGGFWDSVRRADHLTIRQQFEVAELFGFETRNKYAIRSGSEQIGWAAEQGRGALGFLARQFLGHWRTFEITLFDQARAPVLRAVHPFRFLFQRLEISLPDGTFLGAIQQRFSFYSKRFEVTGQDGRLLMTVDSPFWRLWTFPFRRGDEEIGKVTKRWAGLLAEGFTDRETFMVQLGPSLTDAERALLLAAGIFIDLEYFERKAD